MSWDQATQTLNLSCYTHPSPISASLLPSAAHVFQTQLDHLLMFSVEENGNLSSSSSWCRLAASVSHMVSLGGCFHHLRRRVDLAVTTLPMTLCWAQGASPHALCCQHAAALIALPCWRSSTESSGHAEAQFNTSCDPALQKIISGKSDI